VKILPNLCLAKHGRLVPQVRGDREQVFVRGMEIPRLIPAIARSSLILAAPILVSIALLAADAPAPQVVAITGGKLLTVSHGTIENGVLVLADGKIAAVGAAAEVKIPKGAQIVDAKGMTVYPGLIDPETNFGLTEISADQMTNDLIERSDEIMPTCMSTTRSTPKQSSSPWRASTASPTPL
jgi:hypothetical protein